jgi:hypothetical protein
MHKHDKVVIKYLILAMVLLVMSFIAERALGSTFNWTEFNSTLVKKVPAKQNNEAKKERKLPRTTPVKNKVKYKTNWKETTQSILNSVLAK